MATRSRIALQNTNGTITSIYCHFDGYPSNNGKILLEHYSDPSKVQELINLGDLSILGSEIGTKHNFDSHLDTNSTGCLAYGRDRGEKNIQSRTSKTKEELLQLTENSGGEYTYLFNGTSWLYASYHDTTFNPLTPEACKE